MKDGCLVWDAPVACSVGQLCCDSACAPADENNCFGCGTACSGATPVCSMTLQRFRACSASRLARPRARTAIPNLGVCVACIRSRPFPESPADTPHLRRRRRRDLGNREPGLSLRLHRPGAARSRRLLGGGAHRAPRRRHLQRRDLSAHRAQRHLAGRRRRRRHHHPGHGRARSTSEAAGRRPRTSAPSPPSSSATPTAIPTCAISPCACRRPGRPRATTESFATRATPRPPSPIRPPPCPHLNATLSSVTVGPGFDYGIGVTNTLPSRRRAPAACAWRRAPSAATSAASGSSAAAHRSGPPGIVSGADRRQPDHQQHPPHQRRLRHRGHWDCSSPVSITSNTYDGDNAGLALAQHPRLDSGIPVPGFITVENNTFKNLTNVGIIMGAAVILERLTANSFTNISTPNLAYPGIAVVLDGSGGGVNNYRPQIKKARNNSFIGNDLGVVFRGSTPIAPDPDLATTPTSAATPTPATTSSAATRRPRARRSPATTCRCRPPPPAAASSASPATSGTRRSPRLSSATAIRTRQRLRGPGERRAVQAPSGEPRQCHGVDGDVPRRPNALTAS